MAGLPRGFVGGLLVGGVAALLWTVLADRRGRTAVGTGLREGLAAIPYLGARVDALFAGQLAAVHRTVAEDVVSGIRSGELLELGSGPGHLAVEIGRRARDLQITTMEWSPFMVQIAEARVHAAGLGRQVKVVLGDPADLPYPDGFFNGVVSLGSLHRWARPEAVLGEIHRVLKPGGRAWLYDLRRDMPEEGWEMIRARVAWPSRLLFEVGVMAAGEAAYGEGEIAALVARSPFGQARIEVLVAELAGMRAPALTRVVLQK